MSPGAELQLVDVLPGDAVNTWVPTADEHAPWYALGDPTEHRTTADLLAALGDANDAVSELLEAWAPDVLRNMEERAGTATASARSGHFDDAQQELAQAREHLELSEALHRIQGEL